MILGIMQPYFFPYLGYFDLINATDHFVIYDTVQFIKHGWINRNRIHKPDGSWQYITIPVDGSSFHASYRTPIKDVRAHPKIDWRKRILGQLEHYEKKAPFFEETIDLVDDCINVTENSIARLNVSILEKVCILLDINFSYSFSSELNIALDHDNSAQERVLSICKTFNANKYTNLPGGRELYDEHSFQDLGITLEFRNLPPLIYSCSNYEFIPRLSIIDVLMWNEPAKVKAHLEDHR